MNRNDDTHFMARALELAEKGLGLVSPNPLVGCVIVKNGKIIGEGFHRGPGLPHGEADAINNCIESPEGADLYVNLEPCCHINKRTPPCVPLILKNKIKRVIVANKDTNPLVSGKGLKILEENGVCTKTGVLREEGKALNAVFFKFIESKMPYIHLKVAQTLDGRMATLSGSSKWISDEIARREVHKLRLKYDAILIGRETLNADNPSLTIRMGVESYGKIPYRIVVGNPEKMDKSSALLNKDKEKTIILSTGNDDEDFLGIKIIKMGQSWQETFMSLGEIGITSILVEGGSKVITSIIKESCFDRFWSFIAPKFIGNGRSFFEDQKRNHMEMALRLKNPSWKVCGDQILLEGGP